MWILLCSFALASAQTTVTGDVEGGWSASFNFEAVADADLRAVALSGGRAFVAGTVGTNDPDVSILAIDPVSGAELWRQQWGERAEFAESVTASSTRVVIGGREATVGYPGTRALIAGFDAATGAAVWDYRVGFLVSYPGTLRTAAQVELSPDGNRVYALIRTVSVGLDLYESEPHDAVYAFKVSDGTLLWSTTLSTLRLTSSIAVSPNGSSVAAVGVNTESDLFGFYDTDAVVECVNATTGSVRWAKVVAPDLPVVFGALSGLVGVAWSDDSSRLVAVGSALGNAAICLNAAAGATLWEVGVHAGASGGDDDGQVGPRAHESAAQVEPIAVGQPQVEQHKRQGFGEVLGRARKTADRNGLVPLRGQHGLELLANAHVLFDDQDAGGGTAHRERALESAPLQEP